TSKVDEFDPHAARFYFACCCGSHVEKSARGVFVCSALYVVTRLLLTIFFMLDIDSIMHRSFEILILLLFSISVFEKRRGYLLSILFLESFWLFDDIQLALNFFGRELEQFYDEQPQ
ncbi:hypothetical protein PFISCL1PPCAC_7068, partial [Pristionchus fissidentatus]